MKIALLTIWHCWNYGAELQTYATVRKLQEMCHEVSVIDFRLQEQQKRTSLFGRISDYLHDCAPVSRKFNRFWKQYIPSTKHYLSMDELRKDPPKADLYLVGSDQVWNPQITGKKATAYFLDFAPDNVELASYASSFGTDKWLGEGEITEIATSQLQKFKGVSCREKQGCDILKETFHLDAVHVIDPSLLHESYPELTGNIKRKKSLAYYQLSENPDLMEFAKKKAEEMGLKFIDVNHQSQITPTFFWNRRSVGQWIKAIAESEFVITHSFHGLALSILYHRPFVVIYNSGNKISRLVSLLQLAGLENRLFTSIENARQSPIWSEPINYQEVDARLAKVRECSIDYLNRITLT